MCKLPVSSSSSSRSSLPPSFRASGAEQVVGAQIRSLEALQDQVRGCAELAAPGGRRA